MHELALAENIIRIAAEEAARNGLKRIDRLALCIGELRGVVPDLLETCMHIAGKATIAEGADLDLKVIAGRAKCDGCGARFAIPEIHFVCPECERPKPNILSGQELQLVELEGE